MSLAPILRIRYRAYLHPLHIHLPHAQFPGAADMIHLAGLQFQQGGGVSVGGDGIAGGLHLVAAA